MRFILLIAIMAIPALCFHVVFFVALCKDRPFHLALPIFGVKRSRVLRIDAAESESFSISNVAHLRRVA
jgi:hypothetical protein